MGAPSQLQPRAEYSQFSFFRDLSGRLECPQANLAIEERGRKAR